MEKRNSPTSTSAALPLSSTATAISNTTAQPPPFPQQMQLATASSSAAVDFFDFSCLFEQQQPTSLLQSNLSAPPPSSPPVVFPYYRQISDILSPSSSMPAVHKSDVSPPSHANSLPPTPPPSLSYNTLSPRLNQPLPQTPPHKRALIFSNGDVEASFQSFAETWCQRHQVLAQLWRSVRVEKHVILQSTGCYVLSPSARVEENIREICAQYIISSIRGFPKGCIFKPKIVSSPSHNLVLKHHIPMDTFSFNQVKECEKCMELYEAKSGNWLGSWGSLSVPLMADDGECLGVVEMLFNEKIDKDKEYVELSTTMKVQRSKPTEVEDFKPPTGRGRKRVPLNFDDLKYYIEKGSTIQEASNSTGIGIATIRKRLKEAGFKDWNEVKKTVMSANEVAPKAREASEGTSNASSKKILSANEVAPKAREASEGTNDASSKKILTSANEVAPKGREASEGTSNASSRKILMIANQAPTAREGDEDMVKVSFMSEVHKLHLGRLSWNEFQQKVSNKIAKGDDIKIKYFDSDGEWVVMNDKEDFEDFKTCWKDGNCKVVRIRLEKN